jgi:hypothetical protein
MGYPSQSRLKELLDYDPGTGVFRWRKARKCRGRIGDVAGVPDKDGYLSIGIDYTKCRAHRLAVIYMTGREPAELVDHIDGNGQNNAWSNLREATHAMNSENRRRVRANKKNGLPLGVQRSPAKQGFIARIRVAGCETYLGTFSTAEEASEAYLMCKRAIHAGCTI